MTGPTRCTEEVALFLIMLLANVLIMLLANVGALVV